MYRSDIMPGLDLVLFDQINTLAARWLVWNSRDKKMPLGIKGFSRKNSTHMWLLYVMNSVNIATDYLDFYLDCSWIDYLYIKFIRKIKHVKKINKNTSVFLIDPNIFANEVCKNFQQTEDIVSYIYDEYWR